MDHSLLTHGRVGANIPSVIWMHTYNRQEEERQDISQIEKEGL